MTIRGGAPGIAVAAAVHQKRGFFPFFMIWSLYMATFGQATPSAFGHYRAAGTTYQG